MKNRKGFILVGVLFAFLFLMLVVPVMVKWIQNDTKISVKDQKASQAFSLAEAAVDRGYWKVKSSTNTFAQVSLGVPFSGYNYDAIYHDINGGSYRIKITSGPGVDQVTIYGEGRGLDGSETRAIQAVYTNTSVPGAILSAGTLNAANGSVVHWGPMMSKGDMTVTVLATADTHFPRKLSMGVVHPFDNSTDLPNTDSLEWWSNYNVPELPIFDFTTMKASAAATNTLDCKDGMRVCTGTGCTDPGSNCACAANHWDGSGCVDSGSNCSCTGSGATKKCTGTGCTGPAGVNCVNTPNTCTGSGCGVTRTNCVCVNPRQCCRSATYGGPIDCYNTGADVPCTDCIINDMYDQIPDRDMDYTWFWRNNVTWQGYTGTKGTIVVQGNLLISSYPTTGYDDRYCRGGSGQNPGNSRCTVSVPPNAWREYQKFDTNATNEYPGDLGKSSNTLTYTIGTNADENALSGGDLGVYGFLYVKGNFGRYGASDIYGSMWVEGNVFSGVGDNTMVFYNSKLKVPTLNVVLTQDSWQEIKPSALAWP